MPSLRKRILRSGRVVWDIRYSVDGFQQSHYIGETDRRTAEKIFYKFCAKNAEDNSGTPAERRKSRDDGIRLSTLAGLCKDYAEANKSPKTAAREQLVFDALIHVLGDIKIQELQPSMIEAYKTTRLEKVAPATVNIEIRVLNTALAQAKRLGWQPQENDRAFKLLRLPSAEPPEWLSDEQIAVLLDTPDPQFRRFLLFALHTGCRRNEILGVEWKDIDLERKQIVIRGAVAKMGTRRTIPITNVLHATMTNWPGGKSGRLFPEYEPNQISMRFRRWVRLKGLSEGISLHSLRATFACQLMNRGVDIYTVSKLLGHSSVKVTEKHYIALDPTHVQNAVNKLDFK